MEDPLSVPPKGLPGHLDRLDRVGQALQGQLPKGAALVATAPSGGPSHPCRGQDLSALAGGAQPCCLDDRVPEVVVVLSGYLPPAQSDPQPHRMLSAAVVPHDALLHGDGTGQGGRRRGERHHQPVTQVLHLGATGFGDGLAEDREVDPADLFGRVGR